MYGIVKFKPENRSNHRKPEGLEGRAAKYRNLSNMHILHIAFFLQFTLTNEHTGVASQLLPLSEVETRPFILAAGSQPGSIITGG